MMNADEERQLLEQLAAQLHPDSAQEPSPDRVAALRAVAEAPPAAGPSQPAVVARPPERTVRFGADPASRRESVRVEPRAEEPVAPSTGNGRRAILVGGAAATVGAAIGIAVGRTALAPDDTEVVVADSGPESEPIAFGGGPPGVTSSASLVNQTWGTELQLDVQGLPDGADYQVVYVATNDDLASGGSFKSVANTLVKCRFNSSLLRTQTRLIQLRDRDGQIVMESDLS